MIPARWNYYFIKLFNYRKAHGNCDVPLDWPVDRALASWVHHIRKSKYKINKSYIEQLREIDFNFDHRYFEWLQRYEELKIFKKQHKNLVIPYNDKNLSVIRQWLYKQKKNKKKLSKKQVELLDKLGIVWDFQELLEERWHGSYKRLLAYKRRFGNTNVPINWDKDKSLGVWVETQRSKESEKTLRSDRKKLLESIGFVWKKDRNGRKEFVDAVWMKKFRKLVAYKEKYHDTLVPFRWPEDRIFARWVLELRTKYRNGKLSKERIDKLDSIGFVWNPTEESWEEMLSELMAFKEKNKHINVPNKAAYANLNRWIDYIRARRSYLSDTLRNTLNDLGFEWNVEDEVWQQRYEELKEYKSTFGHTRVYQSEQYKKLRSWTLHIRNGRTILSETKRKLLDEIGFEWEITGKTAEDKWQKKYHELIAYRKEFGDCRVPDEWPVNPTLATWVSGQRKLESTLPKERKSKLDALGFTWKKEIQDEHESRWREMYERLKSYHSIHNHSLVPTRYIEDPTLAAWVARQRQLRKKGKLSQERRFELAKLAFVWDGELEKKKRLKEDWKQRYAELKEYYEVHGSHPTVSTNKPLASWSVKQRSPATKLTKTQIELLNKISFAWSESIAKKKEDSWDTMFDEMASFQKKFGHCRVSSKNVAYKKLGAWVAKQRMKEESLSPERMAKLKDLGFLFKADVQARESENWMKKYEELVKFKEKHGHANVPAKWKENLSLGVWLDNLKRRPKTLDKVKLKMLKLLGIKIVSK